jgi:hypothetical protein
MSFDIDGYAIAPLFARKEILALREVVAGHMERLARALLLPEADAAQGAAFDERIEQIAARDPSYATLIGSALATDAYRDPRAQAVAEDRRLTEAAEALIGARVAGRTVRFRGNSSAMSGHRQHWHSDVALADGSSCSSVKLACWIPLSDAGPETGGLELAVGKRATPLPHDPSPGRFHIADEAVANAPKVSPAVPVGSVLLMDRFTPHRALKNTSGKTRWSLVVWMKA